MPILALGVSYRAAPVELLERLSFAEEELPKAYGRIADLQAVSGAVVLSTCNRVEVYGTVESFHAGFQDLKRFLEASRDVPPEDLAAPLYSHYERDAAEHLFGVASGIDSMVIGEPQILTQVRRALASAEAEHAADSGLRALFGAAIRAGKRVRAETAVAASPAAFVELGLDVAERTLPQQRRRSAVVVGAGTVATLAAAALRRRGIGGLTIANRTEERAERLAGRVGASVVPMARLADAVSEADVLVTATGATGTVVGTDVVTTRQRPLFVLDLAVPRDVDPAVAAVPGVRVATVDDLRAGGGERAAAVAQEVARATAVVADEVRRFEDWKRAQRLAPLIRALQERGDRVRDVELSRVAARLRSLEPTERAAVEALARSIVAKLLHDPIVRLKAASPAVADAYARTLAELFGIEPPPR